MFVNFNILNQLGSPAINSNTFANRPAAGQTGRLFVSTDTFEIYRDNGTTWDLIGGPGSSTITGTGTATQVAYFTSSQAIGSSANLYWDDANIRLGIGTATPGARLDIHGSNVMAQFNGTTSASNSYIAFQRTGSNVWRLGDNYNSGDNFFELRNSVLSNDALTIQATTNKAAFLAQQTYLGGQAQGALFTYNLTAPAGTTFATPNALSAVNAFLNLSLGGNATLPAGTRQGIEGNSRVSFTGAGTLTMSQGSTLRAYAAITGVHSFAGSAVGTITHLAGLRLCFSDNIGSAINITNNYALLINDQSAGTGTITYTNRWGIYQEGASDLNYFAANLLIGSTVNNGAALQVTGNGNISGNVGIGTTSPGYKLHVVGPNPGVAAFFSNASNADLYFDLTSGISLISPTTGTLAFGTSSTERMRITSTGNVGIGTTSPGTTLDVNGLTTIRAMSGSALTILGDETLNSNFGITWITPTYSAGIAAIRVARRGATDASDMMFFTAPNGDVPSERMRITSAGLVGIGTNSPASILHVSQDAPSTGSKITITNTSSVIYSSAALELVSHNGTAPSVGTSIFSTNNNFVYGTISSNQTNLYGVRNGGIRIVTGLAPITFGNGNSDLDFANERMRIVSGGNVLIGTTTDAGQKLQISGSDRIVNILGAGGGANSLLRYSDGSTAKYSTGLNNGNYIVYDDANNAYRQVIDSFGSTQFFGSIETDTPNGGTAGKWKFGIYKAAAVTLNTANYIELDIGGTLYKLAVVT